MFLVLVDDADLRCDDGQIDVVLVRRVEELVVDVALDEIALAETLVPRGARAVDLDALDAHVLLRQRRGEQGDRLGEKAVEPLARVVFSDGK